MTRPLIGIACSNHLIEDTYEVQATGRRTIDAVGDATLEEAGPILCSAINETRKGLRT